MEIIDGKALLVNVREPGRIQGIIPKSKVVSPTSILVNWGMDECRILANMGVINTPSPILKDYKWPGMYTPFDHQRATASFLSIRKRAFCFNEQGTGKSCSVAWAADYLMEQGLIKRALIVAPVSIMDCAWRADLFKTVMHRTVDIAHGSPKKRKDVINSDAEFVIINPDGLPIMLDELQKAAFDLIVCDEATWAQNVSTNRWKALNKLLTPDTWTWQLTGTPAAQSPVQAFGLAKIVNPTAVPRTKTQFQDMVMTKVSQFRWVPKITAPKIVHQILQPAIRFTKDECLDLPEITYVRRDVPMTKQQQFYYDKMRKDMMLSLSSGSVSAANAAVAINKLLQIACGAALNDDGEVLEFDISGRYSVLKEVIEESSQKVLVFTPFRASIHQISDRLNADGISCEVIYGDVPPTKRTEIFRAFQDSPDPRVLVIQPQSAAHGVTLTAANTVVWWGGTPSVEIDRQANARVHRPGQHHPCTVIRLQGSPVERKIYNMLDAKEDVHEKILDLYKGVAA